MRRGRGARAGVPAAAWAEFFRAAPVTMRERHAAASATRLGDEAGGAEAVRAEPAGHVGGGVAGEAMRREQEVEGGGWGIGGLALRSAVPTLSLPPSHRGRGTKRLWSLGNRLQIHTPNRTVPSRAISCIQVDFPGEVGLRMASCTPEFRVVGPQISVDAGGVRRVGAGRVPVAVPPWPMPLCRRPGRTPVQRSAPSLFRHRQPGLGGASPASVSNFTRLAVAQMVAQRVQPATVDGPVCGGMWPSRELGCCAPGPPPRRRSPPPPARPRRWYDTAGSAIPARRGDGGGVQAALHHENVGKRISPQPGGRPCGHARHRRRAARSERHARRPRCRSLLHQLPARRRHAARQMSGCEFGGVAHVEHSTYVASPANAAKLRRADHPHARALGECARSGQREFRGLRLARGEAIGAAAVAGRGRPVPAAPWCRCGERRPGWECRPWRRLSASHDRAPGATGTVHHHQRIWARHQITDAVGEFAAVGTLIPVGIDILRNSSNARLSRTTMSRPLSIQLFNSGGSIALQRRSGRSAHSAKGLAGHVDAAEQHAAGGFPRPRAVVQHGDIGAAEALRYTRPAARPRRARHPRTPRAPPGMAAARPHATQARQRARHCPEQVRGAELALPRARRGRPVRGRR